ncbi:CPBP family intramembrane glutamic endopeptidase [Tenacibaculum sp. MEBiC06402]|uniref:CPBP family intramembrane glutamic endopeptidase n=1 Tax=unclassified Tenacibaculum TaxID=2635139 RepID=UPI003B9B32A0
MNTFLNLSRKGWHFVVTVVILSIIPYFFILQQGNTDSIWTLILMWTPTIAALIIRLSNKEGIFTFNSWNPLKDFKWLLLAAFIPLIIELLSLFITLGLNGAELKPEFINVNDGLISLRGVGMIFGTEPQPWYILLPNYLFSYFIGVLLYSLFFAFGEEYGWRGYLQKEWAKNNELSGFITIGIVWGLWHLPGILMGHNYPDYPVLGGFILMPMLCSFFSIIFGITKNRKNVIWVAVLFHGALNLSTDVSNTALIEESINKPLNDFVWGFLWGLTAIITWLGNRIKQKSAYK